MGAAEASGPDYSGALENGVRRVVARALPDINGERLDALMAELFGLADSALAALVAKDPPRRAIACKAGCAYCCVVYVQVTPLEALHVARSILARPAAEVAAARQRVAAAHATTVGRDSDYRIVLAQPCPLLVDGRCSVYADRPFACRGANSADANACRDAFANPGGPLLPTFIHQSKTYAALGRGTAKGLSDTGVRPTLLELIAALHLALAHDDPLAAWRSGDLDFTPARCVMAKHEQS